MAFYRALYGSKDPEIYLGVPLIEGHKPQFCIHEIPHTELKPSLGWPRTAKYSRIYTYNALSMIKPFLEKKKKPKKKPKPDGSKKKPKKGEADERGDKTLLRAFGMDVESGEMTALKLGMTFGEFIEMLLNGRGPPKYDEHLYKILCNGVFIWDTEKHLTATKKAIEKCWDAYRTVCMDTFISKEEIIETYEIKGSKSLDMMILKRDTSINDGSIGLITKPLISFDSLVIRYDVREEMINVVIAESIARAVSHLGATYYFSIDEVEGDKMISIIPPQTTIKQDPVTDILDAYLDAMDQLIKSPDEHFKFDAPLENRLSPNFNTNSFIRMAPNISKGTASVLSKKPLLIVHLHPDSPLFPSTLGWVNKHL